MHGVQSGLYRFGRWQTRGLAINQTEPNQLPLETKTKPPVSVFGPVYRFLLSPLVVTIPNSYLGW